MEEPNFENGFTENFSKNGENGENFQNGENGQNIENVGDNFPKPLKMPDLASSHPFPPLTPT